MSDALLTGGDTSAESSGDTSADSSVSLAAVHGALSLFVEAIAGEPMSIEAATSDRDCWPWQASSTPRRAITAPAHLDEFSTAEENRIAYRASVLHQALAGVIRRLDDSESARQTASAQDQARSELSPHERPAFDRVVAILNDLRIDTATRHRFPGSAAGLDAVLRSARAAELAVGATPVAQALSALRLRSLGADPHSIVSRFPGIEPATINAVLAHADGIDSPIATREDITHAALCICRLLRGIAPWQPEAGAESPPDESDELDDADAKTEVSGGAAPDQSAVPETVEPGALAGGQTLDDPAPYRMQNAQATADSDEAHRPVDAERGNRPRAASRTYLYDEWDYTTQHHLPAWCRVVEDHLKGDDHSFIGDVRSRHVALRARIRRGFARLRPTELLRVHRSLDGDELDLDAAIEAVVDRRSGAPPDDRLHVRRDRAKRDVATAFLLDLSASTSSPAVTAEPAPFTGADPYDDPLSWMPFDSGPAEPERRVIDIAKDAVALMGDALGELGDDYAIYGFSGTGRANVEFKIAKDFGERVSASSWAAVAAMKPLRYTRMGPAIRHATTKLQSESTRMRLLIVISDGYPQDTDYGADRTDRDYGIHDTARALADAHAGGVETFCVTIDPAGHDYLRRMCPDHRYLVIDEIESLPEELAKLYLTLSTR